MDTSRNISFRFYLIVLQNLLFDWFFFFSLNFYVITLMWTKYFFFLFKEGFQDNIYVMLKNVFYETCVISKIALFSNIIRIVIKKIPFKRCILTFFVLVWCGNSYRFYYLINILHEININGLIDLICAPFPVFPL